MTPWGDADAIRARALNPGPGVAREEADRNRRERLFAAMVVSVAERGYEATTVAHLTEIARVSRTAFYAQFRSKEDCLIATIDEITRLSHAVVQQAFDSETAWEQRLLAALQAIAAISAQQPEAAALIYRDAYTAGPDAVARAERLQTLFDEMALAAILESPERAELPPEVVRAVLGGLHVVIEEHVRSGKQGDLPGHVPALWQWMLSYRAPDTPLRRPRVPAGSLGTPRRILHDPEERILDAVVDTVADQGYGDTTVADIARAAAVSLSTFYAHFDGKEDVFLRALERGRAQAAAAVMPSFARAPDWEHGVRAGMKAVLGFLAVETGWARVVVAVSSVGERATAYNRESLQMFSQLLISSQGGAGGMPGPTRTAIGGATYTLIADEIRAGRLDRLPELVPLATFLCLAPYVGPERAAEVANADAPARA